MTGLIKINHAQERDQKLQEAGKVKYFDSPEQMKAMDEFSKRLIQSKKQYVIKNAQSIKSSKEAILTH